MNCTKSDPYETQFNFYAPGLENGIKSICTWTVIGFSHLRARMADIKHSPFIC